MTHQMLFYATTSEHEWADADILITIPRSLRPALFRACRASEADAVKEAARQHELADEWGAATDAEIPGFWEPKANAEQARAKAEEQFVLYAEAVHTGDLLIGHSWARSGQPRNDTLLREAFDEAVRTARREFRAEKKETEAAERKKRLDAEYGNELHDPS